MKTRWSRAGWGFVAWTLLGLAFGSQFYLSSYKAGIPVTWGRAIGWALGDWYVFGGLSLGVFWLARRYPLGSGESGRNVIVHLVSALFFAFAYMVVRAAVAVAQGWLSHEKVEWMEAFRPLVLKTWHFNILVYCALVTLSNASIYYRKFQERELRATELERDLAQARLEALQMQLNPHFLFNTLHGIAALMHQDVHAADRMLVRLGELLRYALESTHEQEVELKREMDFLLRYLEIEQARFGERLRVTTQIEPATLPARIPNLILQPLVENAIRHGIEPFARPGIIEIAARREQDRLIVEVRDNGRGLGGELKKDGVGLRNSRARLQQLYGENHRFELRDRKEGGLSVFLEIPFMTHED